MNSAVQDSRGEMPQLDSLRALAFLGVACSHWLTTKTSPLATIGGTGVQLFFVLSGFLITGILLDYRRIQESNAGLTAGAALRTFYARRFLRIFPLFYGVIAGAAILNIGPIRDLWPWHVSYASNFLYARHQPVDDPFSHFWTLGVEEQFYLVWPFLVFFLPLKTLKRLTLALVILAPIFRLGMEHALPEFHRVNYLPLSCGDALGLGAYLALASRHEQLFRCGVSTVGRRMGLAGLSGAIVIGGLILSEGRTFLLETLGHTFLVLIYAWVVLGAAQGFGGPIGQVLNRAELRYLGKISYGLYVFHHFFTRLDLQHLFQRLHLPVDWVEHSPGQLVVRFALTVVLASASWHLYEKPLNNLKRHFTIQKKLAEARGAQPVALAGTT